VGRAVLRYSADRRTLAFITAHFVLLGTAWATWPLVERYGPTWSTLARAGLVAALAISAWINAVITHNVMHTPVWKSRRLNSLTQLALSLTYGFPVSEYVPGHNLSHHRYTQTARDVMRTSKLRYPVNILNILFFFLYIGPGVTATNAIYAKEMRRTKPKWASQLRLEIMVTWSFKLALIALDWRRGLLLAMVPALYAVWGITTVNYLQHDGCDPDHPYNHSRNFVGRVFNWFTFNNGFHGIHHEAPGLHWSLLPQEHAQKLHGKIDPRLEQRSLLVYLFRAFVLPGVRRTYDGKPVVLPPKTPDEPWFTPAPEQRADAA